MNKNIALFALLLAAPCAAPAAQSPVDYVNTFLGTAPITDPVDIGFTPPWRVWAGLTFPGASLPNAMVQLSPITKFGSGAGYEYEDTNILGFAHSNKGHWNLCNIPILPVTGEVNPDDFKSGFSHARESAHPGYYQVFLERYGINAELTTTLRCGFHRYTYPKGQIEKLVVNLPVSNERVRGWVIDQDGDHAFSGYQSTQEKFYFYAVTSHKITGIEKLEARRGSLPVVTFAGAKGPLEIRIGISLVSVENAKMNLAAEIGNKSFERIRKNATKTWEALLSKVQVTGGTEKQRGLFYSSLYRSFLWPALRSDVNGEFLNDAGKVVKKNYQYYTLPSLWDDYRNKLVLLGWLAPQTAQDVVSSLIDRGEISGFIPTFFHGDHGAVFITGTYLRGLTNFDVPEAYRLLLRNATIENNSRPHLAEYIARGFVSTPDVTNPVVETKAKAGVTKTLEYAYDDYAVALLAKAQGDMPNYDMLMQRSYNFTNVFDPSTGLMRGRLANGDWVTPFNPEYPYYEYMYREANAWQSSFFVPHNTPGLIALFPSPAAFEQQLDRLFTLPWNPNYIAWNINSFIGQYCHGNQPDHNFPYLYYFVGRPDKTQRILDEIMRRFYGMGPEGLTLCGMDDCGEMSSWYVFNAIGLYTYSPADPEYIVTVPIFNKIKVTLGNGKTFTITKPKTGRNITGATYHGQPVKDYFITHAQLQQGKKLVIKTEKN